MTGNDAAYKIAFDEGRRTIDGQEQSLKELRDRAGVLATTAAATAALAAGLMFRSGAKVNLSGWATFFLVLAGLGFLVALGAAIAVWWPVMVTFNMDADVIVNEWVERDPPLTEPEMHRWLAYYMGGHARSNKVRIYKRIMCFSAGLTGLAVETGGLILMLVAKR